MARKHIFNRTDKKLSAVLDLKIEFDDMDLMDIMEAVKELNEHCTGVAGVLDAKLTLSEPITVIDVTDVR